MKRINTDANRYVVFDTETNGLKSKEDDLLSISFYKPDDGKSYNRFLPLELASEVKTTQYNGITKQDLIKTTPLTQKEFDFIIKEYELDTRIILTYSGKEFDERFLREYLKRKNITGYEKLNFYNFKKQIISSKFSKGNISKDNLCVMFGISNVQNIHSGINDCRLEWELFKKLDGFYYLITEGKNGFDNAFKLSSEYIIPVGFLSSHPNLRKLLKDRPYISCSSELIKSFEINPTGITKFDTNITGMTIEHLINIMLKVKSVKPHTFLIENKKKLEYIVKIPSHKKIIPMLFNSDGTLTIKAGSNIGQHDLKIGNEYYTFSIVPTSASNPIRVNPKYATTRTYIKEINMINPVRSTTSYKAMQNFDIVGNYLYLSTSDLYNAKYTSNNTNYYATTKQQYNNSIEPDAMMRQIVVKIPLISYPNLYLLELQSIF